MVAMGLLVISVGFEVIVHRTYGVDVRVGDVWRTIAVSGSTGEPYRSTPVEATEPIVAGVNDTLQFRVRVDNGYPWSYSEHYYVTSNSGITVADGELAAASRGYGEATFGIVLGRIVDPGALAPEAKTSPYRSASLNVAVGSVYLYASFQVQEAS